MAERRSVRIQKGKLLSLPLILVATFGVFLLAIYALEKLPQWADVLVLIAISAIVPVFWSTRYILEIDPEQKRVHRFTWFYGRKIGKPTFYQSISRLYLKEVRSSQTMHSQSGHAFTARYDEYAVFLKFEGHETIELLRSKNKGKLLEKIKKIGEKLNIEPVEIAT